MKSKVIKHLLLLLLVLSVLLIAAGCGGGGGGTAPTKIISGGSGSGASKDGTGTGGSGKDPGGTGDVFVFLTDAPNDSVLAMKLDVTSLALRNSSTGTSTSLLSGGTTVEVKRLELAPTLAVLAKAVPAAAYDKLVIGVTNPRLQTTDASGVVAYASGGTTPAAHLANLSVTLPVSFTVSNGTANGLTLDLNLGQSITVDGSGDYLVNPILTGSPVTFPASSQHVGNMLVQVSAISSTSSVNAQVTGTTNTIKLISDANTLYDPLVGSLGQVSVGDYLEIDGILNQDGTVTAVYVNPGPADLSLYAEGTVTSVGPMASGDIQVSVATGGP